MMNYILEAIFLLVAILLLGAIGWMAGVWTRRDSCKAQSLRRRTWRGAAYSRLLYLCIAHTPSEHKEGRRLVWIDVGNGTEEDEEILEEITAASCFDSVYVVYLPKNDTTEVGRKLRVRDCSASIEYLNTASHLDWAEECGLKGMVQAVLISSEALDSPEISSILGTVKSILVQDGVMGILNLRRSIFHSFPLVSSLLACCGKTTYNWKLIESMLEDSFYTIRDFVGNGHRWFSPNYHIWIGQLKSIGVNKSTPWDVRYYDQPLSKQFKTFLYGFTWEDPKVDMEHLHLDSEDSMLVITSAGDNALHYALSARPKKIHCVDVNPYQTHILELKLAAIKAMNYDTVFNLFGTGRYHDFTTLLDSKLSPYLTREAYDYWRTHAKLFEKSFYMEGHSGIATRIAHFLFSLGGVKKYTEAIASANTLEEQISIWREKLRPTISGPISCMFWKNPLVSWYSLGVPKHQRGMFLEEGTVYEYLRETLDPVISTYHIKTDNYFYLMPLLGRYMPQCCPEFMTPTGLRKLQSDDCKALDSFVLHTDLITNVLKRMQSSSLTKVIVMDHLDWFDPLEEDLYAEITELQRVVAPGGFVFWRSASKTPWYNNAFEKAGFRVECLATRSWEGKAIDRVNMYASFWKGVRRAS